MLKAKIFTLAALLVVLMSNVYVGRSQTSQSDTVWSKYIGSEVKAVKFSPDGQFIYAAALGRGPLKLRTETGEILTEFDGMVYNHSQNKYCIDISMDGNFLYAADTGRYIFKYDTKSGIVVDKIETPYSDKKGIFYRALTISDLYIGVLIIYDAPTGNDPLNREGVVIVFDKNTKEIVKDIKTKIINRVKFSPNGEYLCLYESAENNQDTRSILLNTENWEEYTTFIHGKVSISDISFSPDGSLLASCGWDGFIKIWDVKGRKLIRESLFENINDLILTLKFTNDSKMLFVGGGNWKNWYIKSYDVNDFKEIHKYFYNHFYIDSEGPISLDSKVYNNKTFIASGSSRGLVLLNTDWITSITEIHKKTNIIKPNPSSSITQINLNIIFSDNYNIEIFNDQSTLINALYSGFLKKGEYNFNWNSSNYPSGTYFCVIKSNNYSDTLKIVVQR